MTINLVFNYVGDFDLPSFNELSFLSMYIYYFP